MMATIDQRFSWFQSVILQTMKNLVINMVTQLSNQQRSNLLSLSPDDMLHTQSPIKQPHSLLSLTCLHHSHIHIYFLSTYHHNLLKESHHHQTKYHHHHLYSLRFLQTLLPNNSKYPSNI